MRHQRGNILFLILLAVVLFAALSYAVTQSLRGGGKDASSEAVTAGTAAMIQFLDQVDTAVLRMIMTKNISPETISFGYDAKYYGTGAALLNYGHNTNCVTNDCRVFHPDGGGASAQTFENLATPDPTGFTSGSSLHPGHFQLYMMQWPYAKTDANDLVIGFRGMSPAVCAEVNRQMNITAQPALAGVFLSGGVAANWDNPGYTISTNASQLIGKTIFAGGLSGSGSGLNCVIFRLIIAR